MDNPNDKSSEKSADKSGEKQLDKLERYLDQVCRGIAGPRAMRQHVRQELREHLKDAVADHVAAGLTEEQAIDRALEDFGGPEVVRAELEATHGHRVMGVVIDKAMQWQERTVKAKWFWSTWAHLALAMIIAGQIVFISMLVIFIVPKFEMLNKDRFLEADGFSPLFIYLLETLRFWLFNWLWISLTIVAAWALFEWCVRGDRKPFIRLAAMGTVAGALLIMGVLLTGVMIVPLTDSVRYMGRRPPEREVKQAMASMDQAVANLEKAIRDKDPDGIVNGTYGIDGAVDDLSRSGASLPGLLAIREPAAMEDLVQKMDTLRQSANNIRSAAQSGDDQRVAAAAAQLRAAYDPLKLPPTTRPVP